MNTGVVHGKTTAPHARRPQHRAPDERRVHKAATPEPVIRQRRARVHHLAEYHARRAATYERAYLRAATTPAALRRLEQTDPAPRLTVA